MTVVTSFPAESYHSPLSKIAFRSIVPADLAF
jgi:hypothetical protein